MTARTVFLQRGAAAVLAEKALTPAAILAVADDILAAAVTTFENLDNHATTVPNNTIETTTKNGNISAHRGTNLT